MTRRLRQPSYRAALATAGFLLCTASPLPSQQPSPAAPGPNIVLILVDDLGYGDLSSYGADHVTTPNLDRLAEQGVRLTAFYANSSQCTPTRAALLTGRYPQRAGGLESALGLGGYGRYEDAIRLEKKGELGLPPEQNAIPSRLREVGYATAMVGKWHLGYDPKFSPNLHGFDFFLGPIGGAVDYFHHTEPVGKFIEQVLPGEHMLFRNGEHQVRDGYYMTDLITDEAVAWINQRRDGRPFFLYLPYTAPHDPYQGPDDYRPTKLTSEEWGHGDAETYAEMIESMDAGIGKVLAKLDEMGVADNTLVMFFSDNGPTRMGSSGGFRGKKGEMFEGGIRVPAIVRWPGRIRPGQVSDQVGIGMDFTASILRVAGASPPPDRPLDGIDMLDLLEKERSGQPRTLFWRIRRLGNDRQAVRDGVMKYVRNEAAGEPVQEFVFDLGSDPQEQHDLSSVRPDELRRLRSLMERWISEVRPER